MDLNFAREVLKTESEAIASLIPKLGEGFVRAAEALQKCRGRVVVTGMGKAGLIGQKISATLSSTGTPSLFLHPAEALHGDVGRVVADDLVLALSNSGETEELLRLIPVIRKIGARIVSILSKSESSLGKLSDFPIEIGRIEEACPLKLAPSASTAALLAVGDALALCVQKERGFNQEQYALFHPAGDLGRRLMRVSELMRSGERNPIVRPDVTVREALRQITIARAGAVAVADTSGRLVGVFTDGDLRRNIEKLDERIERVMTRTPTTITPDRLATEAARILRERKIDELPVVDSDGKPVGMLDIQDLLAAGLI